MTQQSKSKNAWQFSIREFFLVVVAASSLLALYANQPKRFEETPFSDLLRPQMIVDSAFQKLGVTDQSRGGGGESSYSRFVSSSYRCWYEKVPGTTQPIVLAEIRKIVKKQILDADCNITGTAASGRVEDDSLDEFQFQYENKRATGQVRVRSTLAERGDWEFWFDLFEF